MGKRRSVLFDQPATTATKKSRRKPSAVVILIAVIVVLLGAVGFLGWKYQQVNKKDATAAAQETSARIIEKVGQLYMLPGNEEPTVAQIQDKEKLGNQEFFKSAENGDYLLIYQEAKVALVYREGTGKLVNVGPVSLDSEQQKGAEGQTAGAETETPSQ